MSEFIVEAEVDGKTQKLKFASATADFGEAENTPLVDYARDQDSAKDKRVTGPVSYAIDGKDDTAWGIDAGPGRRNQSRNAVFVLDKPLAKASKLTISLAMKHGGWNSDDLQTMNLGRFRISFTSASNAVADPLPKAVREALSVPRDKRTPAQMAAEFSFWRTTVPEWKPVNREIELAWKSHPEGTTTLVLDKREQPRMTSMLKRGDFLKPGDRVSAGVPAVLNPLPKNADGSRLTFARWMVDRKSPTTARAFVNRVWQSYFGTGLVNCTGSSSPAPPISRAAGSRPPLWSVIPTTGCWRTARVSGWTAKWCATFNSVSAACSIPRSAVAPSCLPPRSSCSSAPPAMRPFRGRRRPTATSTAALYTYSVGAARLIHS